MASIYIFYCALMVTVFLQKRFVLGYLLKSSQAFGGKIPAFCLDFTSASSARPFPYKKRNCNLQLCQLLEISHLLRSQTFDSY